MVEPPPFDLLFDIVGISSFSIVKWADQHQCVASGLGHILEEFMGHSCPDAVGRDMQGTISMFEGIWLL